MELRFEVPGEPAGKGRHRTVMRRGRGGQMVPVNITPDKTVRYESDIALFAAQAMAGQPLMTGPLWMIVKAWFQRPKSHKPGKGPIWVETKPDSSNVLKAVEDALNGVVYEDDCHIADTRIVRMYCDDGRPRVEVWIGTLANPQD